MRFLFRTSWWWWYIFCPVIFPLCDTYNERETRHKSRKNWREIQRKPAITIWRKKWVEPIIIIEKGRDTRTPFHGVTFCFPRLSNLCQFLKRSLLHSMSENNSFYCFSYFPPPWNLIFDAIVPISWEIICQQLSSNILIVFGVSFLALKFPKTFKNESLYIMKKWDRV